MSIVNRFGLLVWLVIIAGLAAQIPVDSLFDLICFVLLVIVGSACLLTKHAPDRIESGRKI